MEKEGNKRDQAQKGKESTDRQWIQNVYIIHIFIVRKFLKIFYPRLVNVLDYLLLV